MSTNAILFSAVTQLKTKIEAAAQTATPEDLAYLATALEKMAGQISLIDIADVISTAKTSMASDAATIKTDSLASISAASLAAQLAMTTSLNNATTAFAGSVTTAVTQAQTTLDAKITQAAAIAATLSAAGGLNSTKLFYFS